MRLQYELVKLSSVLLSFRPLARAFFGLLALLILSQASPAQPALQPQWLYNDLYYLGAVAYSPNGNDLAIAGGIGQGNDYRNEGGVQVFDSKTGLYERSVPIAPMYVSSIAFSPDGKTLAIAGQVLGGLYEGFGAGLLETVDFKTGRILHVFPTAANENCESVAFSPDGTMIADGGLDYGHTSAGGVLELWQVADDTLLESFDTGATAGVYSVAFSPNGQTLADGGAATTSDGPAAIVEMWDVSTGSLKTTLSPGTTQVYSVTFSPDGTKLAAGASTTSFLGNIDIWNASTGTPIKSLTSNATYIRSLAFSPNGSTLADGGAYYNGAYTGVLETWNTSSWASAGTLATAANYVSSLAYSPTGDMMADAATGDDGVATAGEAELWKTSTSTRVATLITNGVGNFQQMTFPPDGGEIVAVGSYIVPDTSNEYGAVDFWQAQTGKLLNTFTSTAVTYFCSASISPDEKLLALGGTNGLANKGTLDILNSKTAKLIKQLKTKVWYPAFLSFSPDGKLLVVGGTNGTVGVLEIWDVAHGYSLSHLGTDSFMINQGAFSPDGSRLALSVTTLNKKGFEVDSVEIWDFLKRVQLGTIAPAGSTYPPLVSFSPDGRSLVVGDQSETYTAELDVYDAATLKQSLSLQVKGAKNNFVSAVCFSRDGQTVFAGTQYNIQAFSALDGNRLGVHTFDANAGADSIQTSPDGSLLAYCSRYGQLAVVKTPSFQSSNAP